MARPLPPRREIWYTINLVYAKKRKRSVSMRDDKRQRPPQEAEADGLIEGRNAVIEALRAGTPIDKIYIARGETDRKSVV